VSVSRIGGIYTKEPTTKLARLLDELRRRHQLRAGEDRHRHPGNRWLRSPSSSEVTDETDFETASRPTRDQVLVDSRGISSPRSAMTLRMISLLPAEMVYARA